MSASYSVTMDGEWSDDVEEDSTPRENDLSMADVSADHAELLER